MSEYTGAYAGKRASAILLHNCVEEWSPYRYHNGKHAYLAGKDASDIAEAEARGVSPFNLYACDIDQKSLDQAKEKTHRGYRNCLYKEDFVSMVRRINDFSFMFIDTCGMYQGAVSLVKDSLPYLRKHGMIAINVTYGRVDGASLERTKIGSYLSESYDSQVAEVRNPISQSILTMRALRKEGIQLHFHTLISYRNVGTDKEHGRPMLIMLGQLRESQRALEPIHFIRLDGEKIQHKNVRAVMQRNMSASDPGMESLASYINQL
jgi:hypothetical protein